MTGQPLRDVRVQVVVDEQLIASDRRDAPDELARRGAVHPGHRGDVVAVLAAIIASVSSGSAYSKAVRSASTRTNVPAVSLKSSEVRPRNSTSALGLSGLAGQTASPVT